MKILVLGLGSIARKHITVLRRIDPNLEVFALRSSGESSPELNVTSVQSLKEVPSDIAFVLISTPTFLHAENIQSVLPLKKPLFIEKPVLLSLEGSKEIAKAIEKADVFTWVGCHLRFHPCMVFLSSYLAKASSDATEAHAYCGSYLPEWQPGRDYTQSFRADATQSGGVHLELIHEMDYMRHLFGEPLKCQGIVRKVSDLAINAPDDAHYNLTYPRLQATITLNYHDRTARRTLTVECTKKTIVLDFLKFSVTENGQEIFHGAGDIMDVYETQMRAFLEGIRTGKTVNSAQSAIGTLALALEVSKQ